MRFKYNCRKCGEENVVSTGDFGNFGMGFDGAIATEIGFGNMMSGGPMGGHGGFGHQRLPDEIVHQCSKCQTKNIVKTP